ncbi:MAG: glycoside hydrolase family 3 C-terminal domain-containing protein [Oscillospiraceae bacterium]|nr:glycoside hydrolase family 3 C-terminal domain-containing protein [Oscillospiraceae bacterium]
MTAKELVAALTLPEKAALVSGLNFWCTRPVERLSLPSIELHDGPHGLRKEAEGSNMGLPAVCFPSGAGNACSFNRALLRTMGETLGREARAENTHVLLGPAVNIKRSPLCGRNFEYFSEDPYLAGELASAYIQGVQSQGVGVSLKHYAVNSQEKRRLSVSAELDERTLREIYLPAFEKAVKEAKPWTLMCAYNKINGTYLSENAHLLTEILRDEWGFEGLVMSDWGAVCDRAAGIVAGLDLEMPASGEENTNKLIAAVENDDLSEELLDKCVHRVVELVQKAIAGRDALPSTSFDRAADHEIAKAVSRESQVLLKNNGILPLKKTAHIVFVGEFAAAPRINGGGSSLINASNVESALDTAAALGVGVRYCRGFGKKDRKYNVDLAVEAIAAAKDADAVVIFAGLDELVESEGFDRTSLELPAHQNTLIRKIAAVQPNTVVVLNNGAPVTMPWIDSVAAVLESYLGGEAVGAVQTEILFGRTNPSAKLAETFPLRLEDTPARAYYPGGVLTTEHREGIYVGYRAYDKAAKEVLFPFGHGLSYTTFAYADLVTQWAAENLVIHFSVTNTGAVAGAEVAQVYVGLPEDKAFHPLRELRGFEKVWLAPGETKEIALRLDARAFQFYNPELGDWDTETGEYSVAVGASSRDIRLETNVSIQSSTQSAPYPKAQFAPYYSADIQSVSDSDFARLLGRPLSPTNPNIGDPITHTDTLESAGIKSASAQRLVNIIRKGGRLVLHPRKNDIFQNQDFMISMALEAPFHWLFRGNAGADEIRANIVQFLRGKHSLTALGAAAKAIVLHIPAIQKRLNNGNES